jgi:hypothetical protein
MHPRFDSILKRRFITSDDVRHAAARGDGSLAVPENCTVTDEARELALKHSLNLQEQVGALAGTPETSANNLPKTAEGSPPVPSTLPDDLAARVAHAVDAVFQELNLGDRASTLLPIVTRRVLAGLNSVRN